MKVRSWVAVLALLMIGGAILWVDQSFPAGTPLDRIFRWSFVIFSIGFAELFLLFIALNILGRIDLARAFEDKDGAAGNEVRAAKAKGFLDAAPGRGPVSLSRLQAFLWTLVIITSYFYKVASRPSDGLPTIPAELLLVMGISGAVYLAGKQTSVAANAPPPSGDGGAGAPPPSNAANPQANPPPGS